MEKNGFVGTGRIARRECKRWDDVLEIFVDEGECYEAEMLSVRRENFNFLNQITREVEQFI